ncbi:hypothetical protein PV395_32925, partial [Streptomyces scabiei]|nr:hypothetical protein [Streptomyces scabiei]
MNELVPGGNIPLPSGTLTIGVPGPFDVSALVTDDTGRVRGDADFVFYRSLIHIPSPTSPPNTSFAVFCLKKKKKK